MTKKNLDGGRHGNDRETVSLLVCFLSFLSFFSFFLASPTNQRRRFVGALPARPESSLRRVGFFCFVFVFVFVF